MDFVRLAIARPVTVVVGVLIVVLAGLVGFGAVPIQLAPNVDRPEITVNTIWPGRGPEEIVDQIVKNQEEELKNVTGLRTMTSVSSEGSANITLEFYLGTNIGRALQEVSDAMRQVADYPDDVEEPTIKAADGASENAIAWIIVDAPPEMYTQHPDWDVQTLYDALDREVKPYIERVDGVAEVNIYGGREQEVQVLVDPVRLAQRGLTYLDMLNALRSENRNVSVGSIAEGKRDYRVRVLGQFKTPEDIADTIVAYRQGGPVYVRDVADVKLGLQKRRGFVRTMGHPCIAMNVIRQSGANVMAIMDDVQVRLDEVRVEILPRLDPVIGDKLRMRQVYDETTYIRSSIGLVTQNLWVGGSIAALVLLIFLRSFVATGVVAIAIPISVIGTFLVLLLLGRSLNVISLAGLAFATGMVVDNAIVVLENIYRHRQMGKPAIRAAYDGGREVVGAIIAATLTTVAVFIPILTIREEAGQLFFDISLAISASVLLSLVVSITVIPAACARLLGTAGREHRGVRHAIDNLFGITPIFSKLNSLLAGLIHWLITGWRGWSMRPALIVLLMGASLYGAMKLMPPLDYLPAGNRNLVFGGMAIPPGYSVEQFETIADRIDKVVGPYLGVEPDDKAKLATLPKIQRQSFGGPPPKPFEPVGVENFFVGAFGGNMFGGVTSTDENVVKPLENLLSGAMATSPDVFGFAAQSSLFGRGVGGGNTIDVEIAGPKLERVNAAANRLYNIMGQSPDYGYGKVRPDPGNFNLPQQEYRANLTARGRELGLTTEAVGASVRALFDGAFAGEYYGLGDTIDIRLLPPGERLASKEQLADIPIATPAGPIVPIASVVELAPGLAPQAVRRVEELSAVTLRVTPPEGLPLETIMRDIESSYIVQLRDAGLIDRTMRIRLEGTAAKLDEVKGALLGKPAAPDAQSAGWQGLLRWAGIALVGVGVLVGLWGTLVAVKRSSISPLYGGAGAILLGAVLGGVALLVARHPELGTARFVWAILVVYLLMCALFESFIYPFVIMFAVPLALVGGFAGLRIVHEWTAANPLVANQNLDVLTILGFVILVGVVVNNAILIVHQALHFMAGTADVDANTPEGPVAPARAVALAVSTRMRPIFMSTLTSVGGMMPLVLFPGAGSELYRGLGSVVVGGLLVSTVFTLVLVPLAFSLTLDMQAGLRAILASKASSDEAFPRPGRGELLIASHAKSARGPAVRAVSHVPAETADA
ncbi:MAG: efflux RND transporter permease subunit [Phycisphaerales bacterium]|nr:efflux RND transporter permease subunit [Phycisphaerales bacterium]